MLRAFYKGLIVSCQAEGDDPFNKSEYIAAFARAAELGGAVAVRAEGIENIKQVKMKVNIPVIGIIKGKFDDDWPLLTPDFSDIESLIKVGCEMVALDVTNRIRPNGLNGFEFLKEAKRRYKVPFIADISTFNEGVIAADLKADMIATTLSGYTPDSSDREDDMHPDYELISELSSSLDTPIIAEGRIWTPTDAIKAIECGAYSVVVGTAITRPRVITQMYSDALKSLRNPGSLLDQ